MKETLQNLRSFLRRMKRNFETLNRTTANMINVIVVNAQQHAETGLLSRAIHMDRITINIWLRRIAKLFVPIRKCLITRYLKEIWCNTGKSIEKTATV